MSEIEILIEYKKQLISFLDELISQLPQEGDLIILRLFISNQIPIKDAMDNFIHKINTNGQELRKFVKERNESFFLEHNIFELFDYEVFYIQFLPILPSFYPYIFFDLSYFSLFHLILLVLLWLFSKP